MVQGLLGLQGPVVLEGSPLDVAVRVLEPSPRRPHGFEWDNMV